MNRTYLSWAAGLLVPATLWAQTPPNNVDYVQRYAQQVQTLAGGSGGAMPSPRPETGKPFSATVTTNTMQVLVDGTRVSHTTTMLEYRDAEGRVRTETSEPGVITIRDAGVTYTLDPANKTASATGAGRGGRGARGGIGGGPSGGERAMPDVAFTYSERIGPGDSMEDLGTVTVNGVPARGTRVTTLVPAGAIGNDRPFRSTSERWFSPDLNLLIKSVSTDPRFGATTYELTNISRLPPDPSLFRVPADYKLPPARSSSNVIEAIEFRGLNRVSEESVRAAIGSKVGDAYNVQTQRDDFMALWKTGRFDDIQVKLETGPRGGVVVRFTFTERP